MFFFFFFQAEDGIRDHCVTGVQTCALPISRGASTSLAAGRRSRPSRRVNRLRRPGRSNMPEIALRAGALEKRFGGLRAVSEVSLDVRIGEIHAVIGPNGAGK